MFSGSNLPKEIWYKKFALKNLILEFLFKKFLNLSELYLRFVVRNLITKLCYEKFAIKNLICEIW